MVNKADLTAADQLFDQSRFNLSREGAAVRSKEVGKHRDCDWRQRVADGVSIREQPGSVSRLDYLPAHLLLLDRRLLVSRLTPRFATVFSFLGLIGRLLLGLSLGVGL